MSSCLSKPGHVCSVHACMYVKDSWVNFHEPGDGSWQYVLLSTDMTVVSDINKHQPPIVGQILNYRMNGKEKSFSFRLFPLHLEQG